MKLNLNKSHSIPVSRSRPSDLPHPDIIISSSKIENCSLHKPLGVILDPKLNFKPQLNLTTSSIKKKSGLLSKCLKIYSNENVIKKILFIYFVTVWILLSCLGFGIGDLFKVFE